MEEVDERKQYTLLWFIENYSYCWHKNGKGLFSPKFTIEGLDSTAWCLVLYPRGYKDEDNGNVSLFLYRSENDGGTELFPLNIELSFLAMEGSALHCEDFEFTFKKKTMHGSFQFLQTDEIHGQRKSEYLPNDTLTVCCKMWKGKGNVCNAGQISARTRLLIEKISFFHVLENFSTHQPNVKQTIQIRSHTVKGSTISSSLYFIDSSCCKDKIMFEVVPSDTNLILQKCVLALYNSSGKLIDCGGTDFECEYAARHTFKLPLSLSRKVMLNPKSKYLRDDKLSLLCKCIFSTGFKTETIEEMLHELPLAFINQESKTTEDPGVKTGTEKLSEYPSGLDDIKAVYTNQRLTDVELKTKTKSFPAHKTVLCARSPVFDAMLTSDMKEKNTNCIRVDDLENDTVQQLLLFLYSDNIENLQWESATHLYYASDKYQIQKLKAMCSSFLAENISISNASDVLLLADTHNDSSLKKIVEDFILQNEEEVFTSKAWKKLIEKNPQLVIETMHLKYKRENETN